MMRTTFGVALLTSAMVMASQSSGDPAVKAYVAFVETNPPSNRENIVAALDLLASAIQGVASTRGDVFKEPELARVHKLRRDIRRLSSPGDSQALATERAGVFVTTAQLLSGLDRGTGAKNDKSLIDAVHTAAEGLDLTIPCENSPMHWRSSFAFRPRSYRRLIVNDPRATVKPLSSRRPERSRSRASWYERKTVFRIPPTRYRQNFPWLVALVAAEERFNPLPLRVVEREPRLADAVYRADHDFRSPAPSHPPSASNPTMMPSDSAWCQGDRRPQDQHVEWVAIVRDRLRYESVVHRIAADRRRRHRAIKTHGVGRDVEFELAAITLLQFLHDAVYVSTRGQRRRVPPGVLLLCSDDGERCRQLRRRPCRQLGRWLNGLGDQEQQRDHGSHDRSHSIFGQGSTGH